MKNKVIIGTASILMSLLLTTGVASAANRSNPWNEVWTAINNLTAQIENIQLIPGPQGPEGPQGPQGETGPQGVQGVQGIPGPSGADITRSNVYQSSSPFYPVPSHSRQVQAIASCNDANDIALSGGFHVTNRDINILISRHSADTTGAAKWEVTAVSDGQNGALMAHITCLRVE